MNFYDAIKNRRSIYGLSKETVLSDEQIANLVQEAVKHAPTAFHSQSARVLVLLGDQHDKLWNLTKDALRSVVPATEFPQTEAKIDRFRDGAGTVLFYEDEAVVKGLQENFPLYKDNFPVWSQQSSGMLQYMIWTALELEGLGASLQHYNELIAADVQKEWKVPADWKLIGQMPFGKPTLSPSVKDYLPLEDRVKVYR